MRAFSADEARRSAGRPSARGDSLHPAQHQLALGEDAAIWATSASDGFASSMYRRRYLSAARSYFRSPFSAYSSTNSRACSSEMNGDLERCLFGAGEVPGGERSLQSCAGTAFGGHEHTFSHVRVRDHQDMSVAAIWSWCLRPGRVTVGRVPLVRTIEEDRDEFDQRDGRAVLRCL